MDHSAACFGKRYLRAMEEVIARVGGCGNGGAGGDAASAKQVVIVKVLMPYTGKFLTCICEKGGPNFQRLKNYCSEYMSTK